MPSVYIHTIIDNNKKYVGQTIGKPEVRWGSKGHRYKGQLFYNAIQKYGWENITHEVYENLTQEEADEMERRLIKEYKTTEREYGYNIALGGKDGAPAIGERNAMSRKVICIETGAIYQSASICAKEYGVHTSSLQESLYNGYAVKNMHFKYIDDDDYVINNRRRGYGVICKETGETWPSVKDCANSLGVKPSAVNKYCRGVINSSNGLHYEHYVI